MPPTPVATIPLYLVIQLSAPGNIGSGNTPQGPPFLTQTPELPEGYTAFPDVGMAYKYYKTEGTAWNGARKRCAVDGASLAVLDSYKKCQCVMELKGVDGIGTWVGIHRRFDDGQWVSVKTGLPVGTIPWQSGNVFDNERDRKCIVMNDEGSGVRAVDCDRNYHFVCEIEIPHL